MVRKALTGAAAMEIKRLYALEDQWGRKMHSQMEIASLLGVSETTVFRTIHKRGAYENVRELPTDAEAEASLQRFLKENPQYAQPKEDTALEKLQAAVAEVKAKPARVNAMLEEIGTIPRSPLDE